MNIERLKTEWFGNIRGDVLSGLVVAMALIPEAIAFSIIAGVDPMIGLYASFCIAIVISIVGGRPGMISAATGAMALLMVTLIAEHGLQYLLAATILTGVIQILFGVFKLARVMKFVPRSVMVGFVNALAILIFTAQLQHFVGETWVMYSLVALTLVIIYVFPRITKAVPSTLVAIIVVTFITVVGGLSIKTVGDLGNLSSQLPVFLIPSIPLTLETLMIIFPYSLALAIVGLLETLLTSSIVDDMTDTEGDKNRESRGQGIANVVAGFFGGMAGCAMIGQSVINVKSGGRGRLSTFIAGAFLMFLIIVLGNVVVQIPMAALVGVMFMVSISTFDWSSLRNLHKLPKTDAVVMVSTVVIVLLTHDLSKGVLAGVLLSAIFFAAKISKVNVTSDLVPDEQKRIYYVNGQLFFASVSDFPKKFNYQDTISDVEINLTHAHLWDDSAIGALDKIETKFDQQKINVSYTGLNEDSQHLKNKIGGLSKASGH
ncbi:SulP family inorganic anion transporter [Virgibacillus flavescens]|uniref:SulP family inorganic anion transporter n=1 Tax=Virgibacillus flavescens TaxID=1611422 RepID=UPI003D32A819